MNIGEVLKIMLSRPVAVLKDGIRSQQQVEYKKGALSVHNSQQLPTIDLLDLFPNLNEEINHYSYLSGTSLVTDMLLLKGLARRFDHCAYLEIGSWRGESLANVGDVTKDLTSITLSPEEMIAYGLGEGFVKVHGIFSKQLPITKIEHDSHTLDFSTLNKKFDLIFVDGDHSYAGVLNDTKKVFPLRKNESSVIVWHDYCFDTENVRFSTLKAILDGIPADKHRNLYHVSNTMCAVYIENANFKTTQTKFPSYPNKNFSLQIKAKNL